MTMLTIFLDKKKQVLKMVSPISIQFNFNLLIDSPNMLACIQLCYIKWKVNHVQHVFILFEQIHASTCVRVHISEVNYVYNL